MTQEIKHGLRLHSAPDSRKEDWMWLMQTAVVLLSSLVLVLNAAGLTGFGMGNVTVLMLVISGWLCVLYGILLRIKHESWFFVGVLLLICLATWILRQQVLEGFRIFWNQASDAVVSGTGVVVPEWERQLDPGQADLCMYLFAGIVAFMTALVCCLLSSAAPFLLVVLLPTAVLAGMILFGVDEFTWLLPALVVATLDFLYSGWRRKGQASSVALCWAVCAAAAAALTFAACTNGVQNWVRTVSADVHQAIHAAKYETKYTSLPEGDLTNVHTAQKAEPALAVTMSDPHAVYLRGFTGAVLTADRWELLDRQALAKNKDLLYWLNLNAFDQNAQFDAAAQLALQESTVTLQNIGACSYYQYVPFSIGAGAWAEAENLNSDGVHADGDRNHVYSVHVGTAENISQVLLHLQTSNDPAVLQYRRAESGYRQFIAHYYLQIPDEIKAQLMELWDATAVKYGGVRNLTSQQAQECAVAFLRQCFPEEGTPQDMELPMAMVAGTSYQYATVAVLTMRYFGIPARYAEGYVITEEMAAQVSGGETMTVDSSCAGAWAEVYQDGIGWIPMDLTPGIGESLRNPNSDGENPGSTSNGKDTVDKQPQAQEEPAEEPEQTDGSRVKILLQLAVKGLLTVLMIAAMLFLVLWIRRKILISQKEEKYRCGDCTQAVSWIYADTARILEEMGFDRGNGSMRQLREPLEMKFGAEFASQFDLVSDLNARALFSSRPLCDADRSNAMKLHRWTLRQLNAEVKWYRRLWLKWMCCLY